MRKIYLIITILILSSFVLNGCNNINSDNVKKEKKLIITSFYPIYIFTKNLTHDIDQIEVKNLTSPTTGCLHDYQMKPSDLIALETADIFIVNGVGMESFLSNVIQAYPKLPVVEAANGIKLIYENGVGNSHVWVSVKNAKLEVKNISKALQAKYPNYKEKIIKNEKEYVKRMEAIEKEIESVKPDFLGKEIITFHEAFPYFAEDFGLKITAVIEREPGSEPTPRELTSLITLIKKLKIKALFAEPQYSIKVAETIARATGGSVYFLDPFVTGSTDDPLDSYEKTMGNNIRVLKSALINQ